MICISCVICPPPKGWSVRDVHDDLSALTEWPTEVRYPGEWSEPTHEDVIRAESTARSVYDMVRDGFKQRGYALIWLNV